MKTKETLLFTGLNLSASFNGVLVATGVGNVDTVADGTVPDGVNVAKEKCRFALNVTGFTGTSMLVEIRAEIAGIDTILGAFTSVTGVVSEVIEVADCPSKVKVIGTAVAVTDFDATVTSNRLV